MFLPSIRDRALLATLLYHGRRREDQRQSHTIKVHVKKLAEQNYVVQVGKGRGARYTIK